MSQQLGSFALVSILAIVVAACSHHTLHHGDNFGFCVLAVALSWFVNCGLAVQVMSARRKYYVNYPLFYADPSNDHSDDFNTVQRAHQNMLEARAPVSILCLVTELNYPILAVLLPVGPRPTDARIEFLAAEVLRGVFRL